MFPVEEDQRGKHLTSVQLLADLARLWPFIFYSPSLLMSWEFCNIWFKKSFWNHFIFRVANSAGCLAETESAGCLHETSVIRPVFHTEHIIDALPSAPFLSRATLIEHPAANLNDFSVSIQKHSIYNLETMSTLICCCLFMLYFFFHFPVSHSQHPFGCFFCLTAVHGARMDILFACSYTCWCFQGLLVSNC